MTGAILQTLLVSSTFVLCCCTAGADKLIKVTTVRTSSATVIVIAENVSATDSADVPLSTSEIVDTSGTTVYGDTLYVHGKRFRQQHKMTMFSSCLGRRVGPHSIDTVMVIDSVPEAVKHVELERCGRLYRFEIPSTEFLPNFKNDETIVVGLPRRLWDQYRFGRK